MFLNSLFNIFKRNNKTQESIVLNIVKEYSPIRTEQVKIEAMKQGVSCADRYLRWLKEKGIIDCRKVEGDRTKTWEIIQ